eukprot:SAG31_NODE_41_length_31342_cov_8.029286_20_plen_78_part_00
MKASAHVEMRCCLALFGAFAFPAACAGTVESPRHATFLSYRGATPKVDGVLTHGEYDDAFALTTPFKNGIMDCVSSS